MTSRQAVALGVVGWIGATALLLVPTAPGLVMPGEPSWWEQSKWVISELNPIDSDRPVFVAEALPQLQVLHGMPAADRMLAAEENEFRASGDTLGALQGDDTAVPLPEHWVPPPL